MWQTVHLQPGVDKKYLDKSYRCKNVKGVNCHCRWFVGWMDSVGQNVGWSVCGWTHRQCTTTYTRLFIELGMPFLTWNHENQCRITLYNSCIPQRSEEAILETIPSVFFRRRGIKEPIVSHSFQYQFGENNINYCNLTFVYVNRRTDDLSIIVC